MIEGFLEHPIFRIVSDAARESGRVRLDGVEWTAVTADGAVVEKGARVVIEKMESIVLTVRKV